MASRNALPRRRALAALVGAVWSLSATAAEGLPAHEADIVVQAGAAPPQALILLFHGVGADARDLLPVARVFAQAAPAARVVCVNGFFARDEGPGRQWFSVTGVTEANRPARMAAVLPTFRAAVQYWQTQAQVGPEHTTLVGFSQGAMMVLAATQDGPLLARQVVSFSGRFAKAPTRAPAGTRFVLVHGDADPVIPASFSADAQHQLQALGAPVSFDSIAGLGHGINTPALAAALRRIASP